MTKIETNVQYEWALGRVEALINLVTEDMPESDPRKIEFTLLSSLVADYSDEHFSIGRPTLQESLRERMFEMGISQVGLAKILGTSQSRISDILSGKSLPTFSIAQTICRELDIPASVVLGL